ncbi:MAG TPA: 50S ribosomal protein L4 [Eubacteriales bacterium]|jgi:large subunit ribosomal protein L4|nr:50S ribosomal protein L4 [Clostridia bacterium]HRR89791.1 50S ribosomal protein L4 [Eubacteriales bacterium]HRU83864.1 50S ribosomal protein L4 [Eubacteriales bacterium]
MIEVSVFNTTGAVVGKMNLSDAVFGREYNEPLIHQVVTAQLANKRQGTKSTLTMAEVRGGGKKPYRQKGTGRARQGSIRAPQFVKGGVVFAPKPRDFSQKINKSMKSGALCSALSEKLRRNEIVIVDDFKAAGKTKEAASALKALNASGTALIVRDRDDELTLRSCSNLENVEVCSAELLNVYDLVSKNIVIITAEAVRKLEEVNG